MNDIDCFLLWKCVRLMEMSIIPIQLVPERVVRSITSPYCYKRFVLSTLYVLIIRIPASVMLAVSWTTWNSGASPDISHLYEPDDLRFMLSSITLQISLLHRYDWSGFRWTPFMGKVIIEGNIIGEYLQMNMNLFQCDTEVDNAVGCASWI